MVWEPQNIKYTNKNKQQGRIRRIRFDQARTHTHATDAAARSDATNVGPGRSRNGRSTEAERWKGGRSQSQTATSDALRLAHTHLHSETAVSGHSAARLAHRASIGPRVRRCQLAKLGLQRSSIRSQQIVGSPLGTRGPRSRRRRTPYIYPLSRLDLERIIDNDLRHLVEAYVVHGEECKGISDFRF